MGLIGIVMISGLNAPIDGSKQLQCIEFQLNWTTHHLHCQIELTIKYEAFEGSNHHPWATHVWQTDSYQLVIPRQWSCLLACARSCSLSRSVARARASVRKANRMLWALQWVWPSNGTAHFSSSFTNRAANGTDWMAFSTSHSWRRHHALKPTDL